MKSAKSKSQNPQSSLQSLLDDLSSRVWHQFKKRRSVVENVLRLSTAFVELLNQEQQQLKCCGRYSSAQIFESIRTRVIRLIAQHADNSVDFTEFVKAYEYLLEQRLSGSVGHFELVSSQNEKRKGGVFYTPDNLARALTLQALRLLDLTGNDSSVEKLLSLKIVDPAMGAGSFLFVALDFLTDIILKKIQNNSNESEWRSLFDWISSSTDFSGDVAKLRMLENGELRILVLQAAASKCLYGLDVDDAAVELVRIGMAKRCKLSTDTAVFPNLRRGNALLGLWQNPDETILCNALKKVSTRFLDLKCFKHIETGSLSDKERRDLVCLQFFADVMIPNEGSLNVDKVARRMKFFHWSLEFPDVFSGDNPGFDLVLANPPWEIEKANSREFFSRYDSSYMSLSKQAALLRQKELFDFDKTIEEEWNHYVACHDGLSAFLQRTAESLAPFRHQGGSDSNSYKLFLELGYLLLKTDGAMAQIVPSGIYSDKGSTELRRLFVDKCRWFFLHGYHNREGIFSIHRSFKFCTLGVVKGGQTNQVDCRFLRISPDEIEDGSVAYKASTLRKLSPEHLAFTEISQASELGLIEKLANVCVPLGALQQTKIAARNEDDVLISFRREFDMTNDSRLFIERSAAQAEGFALDIFGHWLKGKWRPIESFDSQHTGEFAIGEDGKTAVAIDDIRRVLLPVYEGRMVGQYDWAKKAWLHGKGRRADWAELPFSEKRILPQYLLDLEDYIKMQPLRGAKIAYLAVGASTNTRSCIASMIGDWPCGNAVPVLSTAGTDLGSPNYQQLSALLACLNSFVFDFLLRMRLSANNLNWFILKECLLPDLSRLSQNRELFAAVCELSMHEALRAEGFHAGRVAPARRVKLRAFVEAVIASAYSIDEPDCLLILRGCDIGKNSTGRLPSSIDKGFHRIDLHLPANLRAPFLFFQSFQLLQQHGVKWLFENLDNDDVLFSQQCFDQQNPVAIGGPHGGSNDGSPDPPNSGSSDGSIDPSNGGSGDFGRLDYRQLMSRIRGVSGDNTSRGKVPNAGILRSP